KSPSAKGGSVQRLVEVSLCRIQRNLSIGLAVEQMLQLPIRNLDLGIAEHVVILVVNGDAVNDTMASPILIHSIQQCPLLLLLGNLILIQNVTIPVLVSHRSAIAAAKSWKSHLPK